jgi:hypothetical protein
MGTLFMIAGGALGAWSARGVAEISPAALHRDPKVILTLVGFALCGCAWGLRRKHGFSSRRAVLLGTAGFVFIVIGFLLPAFSGGRFHSFM